MLINGGWPSETEMNSYALGDLLKGRCAEGKDRGGTSGSVLPKDEENV